MGKLRRASVRGHTVAAFARSLESGHKGAGRPTLDYETLSGDRDALVWLLSVTWSDIGWQLPQATTPEELRRALEPLRGHPYEQHIARFIRATSVTATAEEIRATRKTLGLAIKHSRETQLRHDTCIEASRIAELAMNVAQAETQGTFQVELFRRWGESAKARRELESAQVAEKTIQEELKDKEASFSQHELLDFITRKKYARNPLRLANAMAGLPDMGWEQSYARCSAMKCGSWPQFQFKLFRTIKAIWNRRNYDPELPLAQLFRQEIDKLSKTVLVSFQPSLGSPAINTKRENPLRSHLADNWRSLRLALEEVVGLETHPDRMPFLIASRFAKNLGQPRTPQDLVLNAREKII